MKKLYRSKNKVVAGILAGLGEYYDIDVTVLRLVFILLTVFTGFFPFVLFYILAIFVMPINEDVIHVHHEVHNHSGKTEKEENA